MWAEVERSEPVKYTDLDKGDHPGTRCTRGPVEFAKPRGGNQLTVPSTAVPAASWMACDSRAENYAWPRFPVNSQTPHSPRPS